MLLAVVGDADGARLARGNKGLEGFPFGLAHGLAAATGPRRREVHEHKINVRVVVARKELRQRRVELLRRRCLIQAAWDLGHDEEAVARDARGDSLGDGLANAILVLVADRRVDVAVAFVDHGHLHSSLCDR